MKALAPKIEFNQQLESCAVIGDVAGAQEVLATLLTDFRATQGAAPEEPSMEALLSDPSLLVEQEEVEVNRLCHTACNFPELFVISGCVVSVVENISMHALPIDS